MFPINHALQGPNECDAAGWCGEETLDVEAVHAMAPGAHILYVGGSDCQDVSLDKALNEVVSKSLAQIVSNSYGELGVPSPDFSASSPWATAVGGTTPGIGADGRKTFETGWEAGKSVLADGVWTPAGPGAYVYGSGGGTSLASPLFAGMMALADDVSGVHHGFINPTLYQRLAGSQAITDIKHTKGAVIRVDYLNGVDAADGLVTSARTLDFGGLAIKTARGYDDVTGLGVPNGMHSSSSGSHGAARGRQKRACGSTRNE